MRTWCRFKFISSKVATPEKRVWRKLQIQLQSKLYPLAPNNNLDLKFVSHSVINSITDHPCGSSSILPLAKVPFIRRKGSTS